MTDFNSKKAKTYLQADSTDLKPLFAKIKELQELNQKVSTYLEPGMATYCQVASLVGHRLVLVVANGSIATQLRFQMMDLLRKFKSDPDTRLQKIQDIHCKVHPSLSSPPHQLASSRPSQKMAPLSLETAQLVHDLAESLEDPKLREIMKKIAARGRHQR